MHIRSSLLDDRCLFLQLNDSIFGQGKNVEYDGGRGYSAYHSWNRSSDVMNLLYVKRSARVSAVDISFPPSL